MQCSGEAAPTDSASTAGSDAQGGAIASEATWPQFSEEEIEAVARVLRSGRVNYWTGDECRQFEREFAEWVGCNHAVALGNGTQALEAALRSLGVGPGDEVVVAPRTFIASASSIVDVGAAPVFADVDPDSQNITVESIAAVLSPRTSAVVCVHLAGWPCEMDVITELAAQHGFSVVEDCAQAHGARYRGRAVGSIGDVAAWSFCQDKIMTTGGEGGMVTTGDAELWSRIWSYKDHGKSWQAIYERDHPPGFRWVHDTFGKNYRMLEIQAAIGRIQVRRMPEWHRRRTENAQRLLDALAPCEALRVPRPPKHVEHAWYKFHFFVRPERLKAEWTRDRILEELLLCGVRCYSGSCPEVYMERAFDGTGWRPAQRLPRARQLGETSLMLHVDPGLTIADMDRTSQAVLDVLQKAVR